MSNDPSFTLQQLRKQQCELEKALALYDSLPSVRTDEMLGNWRGEEFNTGNELDGLLNAMNWHGKKLESTEAVYPLIFQSHADNLICLTATMFSFIGLVTYFIDLIKSSAVFRRLLKWFMLLFQTSAPCARLRMVEFRGVSSAAMVYDKQPIIEVFRKVDSDTVIGAMDCKGQKAPLMFVLRRESHHNQQQNQ